MSKSSKSHQTKIRARRPGAGDDAPLALFLDPNERRQASRSLYRQLRDAIASGRVREGARLPPSRLLAAQLGVSRHTVTTVYGQLAAEGYIGGNTGAGTFVNPSRPRLPRQDLPAQPRRQAPPAGEPKRNGARFDLLPGSPDPSLFPAAIWRRCLASALHRALPGYGDPAGSPALREEIAYWIGRSRGVEAKPEQVVVTAGAQQAIDLVTRVLVKPGDVVAVENPGYPPVRRLCAALGADVRPVGVDGEGIIVSDIPRRARLVYTTPSHQFPTGAVMSLARRHALLDRADRNDMTIVEDDYDSEYRHVARPLEPLQRIDHGARVVYVGTFSKTLSPSLRLGFAVLPTWLIRDTLELRSICDWQPAEPQQTALEHFIAEGHLGRHLRRTAKIYRERHNLVAAFVRQGVEEGLLEDPARSCAGLHTTVQLADHIDESRVRESALQRGVAVGTLGDYWLDGVGPPGLVIGYGMISADQLGEALAIVMAVLGSAAKCEES